MIAALLRLADFLRVLSMSGLVGYGSSDEEAEAVEVRLIPAFYVALTDCADPSPHHDPIPLW